MPSGDFVRALIRAHADGDEATFYAVAHQMAAREARLGHSNAAAQLNELLDELRSTPTARWQGKREPTAFHSIPEELKSLLFVEYPSERISRFYGSTSAEESLSRLITESINRNLLLKHGLKPANKALFVGAAGSGKTFTAKIIASETGVPLFRVSVAQLALFDETRIAAVVNWLFTSDQVRSTRAVMLFEDWYTEAASHSSFVDRIANDRVRTTVMRFLRNEDSAHVYIAESDAGSSTVVGQTASIFDIVVRFGDLEGDRAVVVMQERLASIPVEDIDWLDVESRVSALSVGRIIAITDQVAKKSTITGEPVSLRDLVHAIETNRGD